MGRAGVPRAAPRARGSGSGTDPRSRIDDHQLLARSGDLFEILIRCSQLVSQYEQSEDFGRVSWWLRGFLNHVDEGTRRHADLRLWLDRIELEMRRRGQQTTPPADPPGAG